MNNPISDIAFTPAVKAAQQARGSRSAYARMEQRGGWNSVITPELKSFIAGREFFYLGTSSGSGVLIPRILGTGQAPARHL